MTFERATVLNVVESIVRVFEREPDAYRAPFKINVNAPRAIEWIEFTIRFDPYFNRQLTLHFVLHGTDGEKPYPITVTNSKYLDLYRYVELDFLQIKLAKAISVIGELYHEKNNPLGTEENVSFGKLDREILFTLKRKQPPGNNPTAVIAIKQDGLIVEGRHIAPLSKIPTVKSCQFSQYQLFDAVGLAGLNDVDLAITALNAGIVPYWSKRNGARDYDIVTAVLQEKKLHREVAQKHNIVPSRVGKIVARAVRSLVFRYNFELSQSLETHQFNVAKIQAYYDGEESMPSDTLIAHMRYMKDCFDSIRHPTTN